MKKGHRYMWNIFRGPTWYNTLCEVINQHDTRQVEKYRDVWVPFSSHMLRSRNQEQFSSVKVDR